MIKRKFCNKATEPSAKLVEFTVKINTHIHTKELKIKIKNSKSEKKKTYWIHRKFCTEMFVAPLTAKKVEIIQMPIS